MGVRAGSDASVGAQSGRSLENMLMPVPRMDQVERNPVFWYAGIDFNTRNLTVQKGDPLPNRWQLREQVNWLRKQYGEQAVLDAVQMEALKTQKVTAPKPVAAAPARQGAEPSGHKKGRRSQ